MLKAFRICSDFIGMRVIARCIVGLLALGAIFRMCVALYVTVKVIQTSKADSLAIPHALGFLAGSACLVALFVWLFRKLAPKDDLA